MEYRSEDNHTFLWSTVISEILYCISKSGLNYCINDPKYVQHSINNKIDEYVEMTKKAMCKEGEDINEINIDRHKFASCVCGTIIQVRPIGKTGKQWIRNTNEIVALQAGINILRLNMIHDFVNTLHISDIDKKSMAQFFMKNFKIKFPSASENICEKQDYAVGLCADLSRTYHNCKYKGGICFHFDVFAYSKIFYHIEMKNRGQLNDLYQDYMNAKNDFVSQ